VNATVVNDNSLPARVAAELGDPHVIDHAELMDISHA